MEGFSFRTLPPPGTKEFTRRRLIDVTVPPVRVRVLLFPGKDRTASFRPRSGSSPSDSGLGPDHPSGETKRGGLLVVHSILLFPFI